MRSLSAPSRRWVAPAAVVLAVGVVAGGTAISASAAPELPARTAAQLLVDLQNPRVDGVSGTVVENADLGLPAIPMPGGGQGSSDLSSLISGSHTLRVWYDGPERVRIALLGTLGESDVIRNGSDLWTWSSRDNSATHRVLPDTHRSDAPMTEVPLTPQQAAEQALAALDPSTAVSTDGTARVAGRDAYELVLAPRDDRSLVGQLRIAIDAETHLPLRVRTIARGATSPAFEVGFTHVSFEPPDVNQFRFSPPPGARIVTSGDQVGTEHSRPTGALPGPGSMADHQGGPATGPTTVGSGWTQVAVFRGTSPISALTGSASGNRQGELAGVLAGLPQVSGDWGSGKLLRSALFTALLTDDGRLLVGPVGPELVYQAAAHR